MSLDQVLASLRYFKPVFENLAILLSPQNREPGCMDSYRIVGVIGKKKKPPNGNIASVIDPGQLVGSDKISVALSQLPNGEDGDRELQKLNRDLANSLQRFMDPRSRLQIVVCCGVVMSIGGMEEANQVEDLVGKKLAYALGHSHPSSLV